MCVLFYSKNLFYYGPYPPTFPSKILVHIPDPVPHTPLPKDMSLRGKYSYFSISLSANRRNTTVCCDFNYPLLRQYTVAMINPKIVLLSSNVSNTIALAVGNIYVNLQIKGTESREFLYLFLSVCPAGHIRGFLHAFPIFTSFCV
jgi:hypothetical protein